MKIRKSLAFLALGLLLAMAVSLHPRIAHAQTENLPANVAIDASCNVTINGLANAYDYVNNGDNVTVEITNASSQIVDVATKGQSPTPLAVNASQDFSFTVNTVDQLEVLATSCSGNGSLFIEGASGSLSCTISDSKVWNIIGQYSNVYDPVSLYRGGTYEGDISNSGSASIDEQFAGESSSQTYYLYDGSSSAQELIGQVSCPAIAAAAPVSTSMPTTTATTSPSSTTTTPLTPPTSQTTTMPTTPAITKPLAQETVTKPLPTTLNALNTSDNKKIDSALFAFFIIMGPISIFLLVCTWRMFSKANVGGWKAIIPVYNTWTLFKIGGQPGWWAILMFIPLVNIAALIILIMAEIEIAHRFSKSTVFGILWLIMFGFVGLPILAFGRSQYSHLSRQSL